MSLSVRFRALVVGAGVKVLVSIAGVNVPRIGSMVGV